MIKRNLWGSVPPTRLRTTDVGVVIHAYLIHINNTISRIILHIDTKSESD